VTISSGPALIDLGEDWADRDRGRDPSGRTRSGPPSRPRFPRGVPAVALAAVVMLLLGGAARVEPRLVRLAELRITEAAALALGPDTAFVSDRPADSISGPATYGLVSAYSLPGGTRRWQTRVSMVPQRLLLVPEARVVLAWAFGGPENSMLTAALDADTGRVLWTTDSGLLAEAPAGTGRALLAGYPGGTVRSVDLRSGGEVWSHPLPLDGELRLVARAGPADRALLLVTRLDGTVEVLAEGTGAVVAAGNVGALDNGDVQLGGPRDPMLPSLSAVGERLMVFRPQPSGQRTVTAFDLRDVRPLWTSTGDYRGYAVACGALICLPGDGALTAVPPDDGSAGWTDDRWNNVHSLDGDRVLGSSDGALGGMAVLATGSGRVRIPLTGWTGVGDEYGAMALVTRPSVPGSGRAWFATLDPGRTAPRLLGDLPRTAAQICTTGAGLLACDTVRGSIQIWRYRT
jgi:hypothetical protein